VRAHFTAGLLSVLLIFACLSSAQRASALVERQDETTYSTKTRVPCYVWSDNSYKEPKAVFIAVHGAAQEGSVMGVLATDLAKRGYLVIAPDVRGNGRWKFTAEQSTPTSLSLLQSADDVKLILAMVHEQFPNQKIFLLGESIGAGIVMKATDETPFHISGLILCSAGVQPHMHNPLNMGSGFIKGIAHLVEPVDLSAYLTRYSSDDTRIAKEMIDNPLARNHQTGLELIGTFNFLMQETSFAEKVPADVPVLVIQGEEDQIVEPSSCIKILLALQSHDKERSMVPKTGHVLVGTSFVKPQVMSCINDWLKKHGGPKGAEFKPNELKPNELKPNELKPNESKPTELKATGARAGEAKALETRSTGTKPTTSKTTGSKSAGVRAPASKATAFKSTEPKAKASKSTDPYAADGIAPKAEEPPATNAEAPAAPAVDAKTSDINLPQTPTPNANHLPRLSPAVPASDPSKASIQPND
jgi:alpha-beta hydrolase superfamily lysophospholipase